jgi:molybdenum cofactor cytidylyltransferase
VLVGRDLFDALAALSGDRGAGELLKAMGPELVLVESPDDGVHFDVDEPADLEAVLPG